MDIPQDVLIDVGLNVAGYVLSGFIAIVIYSMVARKRSAHSVTAAPVAGLPYAQPETAPMVRPRLEAPVEFVRFGGGRRRGAAEPTSSMSPSDRRNIVETIATARRMMEAGTTAEQIKRTLPISDAELALLKFEIER